MKVKVDIEKIPEELKPFVKEEMTKEEVALLGNMIIKLKKEKIKNKLFGWYNGKRHKEYNKKEI